MYDVLVYVFEHCRQADVSQNSELVAKKLSAAGFEESDISEALHWLAGVLRNRHRGVAELPDSRSAFRAYAVKEMAKLGADARGYLMTLERSGVLTPLMRELVIERALAASGDMISLEQIKLIVLMVMWNHGTEARRLLAEELFAPSEHRLPN